MSSAIRNVYISVTKLTKKLLKRLDINSILLYYIINVDKTI